MAEPAFANAGKQVGLELWRIENLAPVPVKVDGKLFAGDSYILLSTTKNRNGKLLWNIHFWLGAETSQDEAGVAAYKTVELDEALGGGPTQYREIQGNESTLFLSYFKDSGGIEYKPGGIASGFKHVDRDVFETRLLQCKGARTVRVSPVPVSNKSLTKGDVYILDLGLNIYIFNGPTANRGEKAKGIEVAKRIDTDERNGRAVIHFLEDSPQNPIFWGPLGGYVDPATLPEGEDDAIVKVEKVDPKLLKLGDTHHFELIASQGKLEKDMLTSPDVFLVHGQKVFLWIGKGATLPKKREATASAIKYIKSAGLPANTQLERVSEGVETNGFKAEFTKWTVDFNPRALSNIAKKQEDLDIDLKTLLANKAIEDTPVDDGTGTLQVWVVSNFNLEEVPASLFGQFYGGDSYIILYTYVKDNREQYIIYFWLGDKSTADEKGTAALLTTKKSDELGGRPVQVRVIQGKEPIHFRLLFKGKLIIHSGGKASGFKNVHDSDSYDVDGIALFRVHGTDELNTRAIQVPEKAESLNSEDTFVLVTPSHSYYWYGTSSNSQETEFAKSLASKLGEEYLGKSGRVVTPVVENSEPDEFWAALGGKGPYASSAPGEPLPRESRLFQCSDATGTFKVEEINQFTQSDLTDEDIFFLDTYTNVFVWIGSQSNKHEKEKSAEFAKLFVADAEDGRDNDSPIIFVASGNEPLLFTAHFPSWDAALAEANKFTDPYAKKLEELAKSRAEKLSNAAPVAGEVSTPRNPPVANAPAPASAPSAQPLEFYPFERVKAGDIPGMDKAQRENYLDDATFKEKLGSDRDAFAKLPKWKRDEIKKKVGIF